MGASDAGKEGEWRWVTGPEGCPGQGKDQPTCMAGLTHKMWYDARGNRQQSWPANTLEGEYFFKQVGAGGQAQSGCHDKVNGKCYTNWARREPNEYRRNCPGDCRHAGEDF